MRDPADGDFDAEMERQERLEAAADDAAMRETWATIEAIDADAEADEWYIGAITFRARPGNRSAGMVALEDSAGSRLLMVRAQAIELRDFLTLVIEGTLPAVEEQQPAFGVIDGEQRF